MDTNATILIADDEPDLRENIQLFLEGAGYNVLAAGDGAEALQILQSQPVDLILADIAMPEINGYQLYEQVRKNPHWAAISFIFLTARKMDSDIRFGKSLGVDDYLTKPIRPADLLAVVQGKLRRSQQLLGAVTQITPASTGKDGLVIMGCLQVDSRQHKVWLNEQEIKLSAREFLLLEYLAQEAGKIISPQELVQVTHQLKTDAVEAGSLLGPLVLSLRRKLGAAVGETGLIENVRGVGYRLITPDS